jgi:tRNA pseudouridine38-40 synthase
MRNLEGLGMRYAIGLEYDGSAFLGWQAQRQGPTIQAALEHALSRVANAPVKAVCCGRTDAGVHALCQVVHFECAVLRPGRSWLLGTNSFLPRNISLLWIRQVDEDFHARFSAFSRSYRYCIANRWVRPALDAMRKCWWRKPLDADLMNQAAQCLRGEHDFSAFRAASCQARHAVRSIQHISVERTGSEVSIEVSANGFLYHMVRNIAGSLLLIGSKERAVAWMQHVLASGDRTLAAPTATAAGLYFVGARYPEQYQLPGSAVAFPAESAGT